MAPHEQLNSKTMSDTINDKQSTGDEAGQQRQVVVVPSAFPCYYCGELVSKEGYQCWDCAMDDPEPKDSE